MRRLHIHVDLPASVPDDLRDAYPPAHGGWMIPVEETVTVEELAWRVTESYRRRYPDFADKEPDLQINEIRDGYGCSLEVGDSVGDIFLPREATSDPRNYSVHIVRGDLTAAELVVLRDYEGSAPIARDSPRSAESSVRIHKRFLRAERHSSPRESQPFKRQKVSHMTYQAPSDNDQFMSFLEQDDVRRASARQAQLLRTATPDHSEDTGSEQQADTSNHHFMSAPESLKGDSPSPGNENRAPVDTGVAEKKQTEKKRASKKQTDEPNHPNDAEKPARKKPGPKKKQPETDPQDTGVKAAGSAKSPPPATAKSPPLASAPNGAAEPIPPSKRTTEPTPKKKGKAAKNAEEVANAPSDQVPVTDAKTKHQTVRKTDEPSKAKSPSDEVGQANGTKEASSATAPPAEQSLENTTTAPVKKKTKATEPKNSTEAPATNAQDDAGVDGPDDVADSQEAGPKRKRKEPTPWYPGKPGRPPKAILEQRAREKQELESQEIAANPEATTKSAPKAKKAAAKKASGQDSDDSSEVSDSSEDDAPPPVKSAEKATAAPAKDTPAKKAAEPKAKSKKAESPEATAKPAPKAKKPAAKKAPAEDSEESSAVSDSSVDDALPSKKAADKKTAATAGSAAAPSKNAVPDRTIVKKAKPSHRKSASSGESDKESASSTTDESESEAPPAKKAKLPPKAQKKAPLKSAAPQTNPAAKPVPTGNNQSDSDSDSGSGSDSDSSISSRSEAEKKAYQKKSPPKKTAAASAATGKPIAAETKKAAKKLPAKKDASQPIPSSQTATSKGAFSSSTSAVVSTPKFSEISKQAKAAKQPPYKNPIRPATHAVPAAVEADSSTDSDESSDSSDDDAPQKAEEKGSSRLTSLKKLFG